MADEDKIIFVDFTELENAEMNTTPKELESAECREELFSIYNDIFG